MTPVSPSITHPTVESTNFNVAVSPASAKTIVAQPVDVDGVSVPSPPPSVPRVIVNTCPGVPSANVNASPSVPVVFTTAA